MSDDDVQNYANHARYLPPYHFVVFPILAVNAIVALVLLARAPSVGTVWAALVALAIAGGFFLTRWMARRVQDRVVRLEEHLRLNRLLPGRREDIESLSLGQLIALRFASDQEVRHMVDRIISGELTTQHEIKRAVQHWRPDHLRA